MSDTKMAVQGVPGRWTAVELKAAELLRLGATEQSVAVELGCHVNQIKSLKKRKHFKHLLDLRLGAAQDYADRWEQIRQRQLDMAGSALDTIEEAIDDRDGDGNVTQDLNARWCLTGCPKPGQAPVPGNKLQVQFWYRDSSAPFSQKSAMTGGLEADVCP